MLLIQFYEFLEYQKRASANSYRKLLAVILTANTIEFSAMIWIQSTIFLG